MNRRRLNAAFLVLAGCQPSFGQVRLEPALLEEDFSVFVEELQQQHAGLSRFTSEEQFEEVLGNAAADIAQGPTALQFYRILCRVASAVRCGHTRVQTSGRFGKAIMEQVKLLPIHVHMVGERVWVLSTVGDVPGIRAGQEILSIDGIAVAEIRRIAFEHLFGDGFIESGKQRELEARFALHYALFVEQGGAEREAHRIQLADVEAPVTVEGISEADDAKGARRDGDRPLMKLTKLTAETSLLSLREFGDEGPGRPDFPAQLEGHFAHFRSAGTQNLILDLRGNGGGDDMYGALLVSYLSAEPFRYFETILVTADYDSGGDVQERDGQHHYMDHPGTSLQQPADNHFEGKVVMLIDGWTFSTAADVAAVAHHNGLASFVGEETGGGYDGNTSGFNQRLRLPNSGLSVGVPRLMYTTANLGHGNIGRGTPVDVPARASIEQALAGTDAPLQAALQWIANDSR